MCGVSIIVIIMIKVIICVDGITARLILDGGLWTARDSRSLRRDGSMMNTSWYWSFA